MQRREKTKENEREKLFQVKRKKCLQKELDRADIVRGGGLVPCSGFPRSRPARHLSAVHDAWWVTLMKRAPPRYWGKNSARTPLNGLRGLQKRKGKRKNADPDALVRNRVRQHRWRLMRRSAFDRSHSWLCATLRVIRCKVHPCSGLD